MYEPEIKVIKSGESVTDSRCVLALDMARKTGASARRADGNVRCFRPAFPKIEGVGVGWTWLKFRHWLTQTKNQLGKIDAVYYEELQFIGGKFIPGEDGKPGKMKGMSTQNARLKFGFEAVLTGWCEHHKIPYKGFAPVTIKKFITGTGKSDKAAVIEAVKALGFDPYDDNVADSIALLMLGLDRMDLNVILPTPEPQPDCKF